MEAVRGRVGSFSDDDDDTSASCLRSLASPSDEDDSFCHRFSQENAKLQISLDDDDCMSKGPEEETPKGGCSPLVRSFAQLSTQGRANLFRRSSLEPTTPMRRFSTDNCLGESNFTSRLTPTSQARTLQRQEFKATRVLSETPSRKPCTPSKHARQEFKASRTLSETPSRKPCTPPQLPRRPLATLNAPLSAVSSTFGSSSKRGVTSGSRLTAPGDASPPRAPRTRTSPKQSLAALPAFANSVRPEGSSASVAFDVDDFLTQPSRPLSPPPRHPASRSANRRLSMGELMPSPISKSWPYGSFERHRDAQSTHDGDFPEISHLPTAESSHPGTPIEPKHMVAPTRPRKRGSAVPPSCYRSILSSPLPAAPAGSSIHDIPELATEACPMAAANSGSDSMRVNKARRYSVLNPRDAGPEAFELDRSMSSPNVAHHRTQSLPTTTRTLSAPGFPPPLVRQSLEEERNERIRCRALTSAMVLHGTKLLCLDWDRTVVGLHTHSRWIGTDDQLALWIRPVFRNLIGAVADSNIRIAFVSFSGQTTCIHGAIRKAFGNLPFCNGRFVVRCSDKNWGLEDRVFENMFPGAKQNDRSKLSHICSAATFFMDNDKENANPQSLRIQPQNIVFIDDDLINVEDANAHDVHSIHMDPNNPDKFLDHLEEMCGITPSPPLALHMTDN